MWAAEALVPCLMPYACSHRLLASTWLRAASQLKLCSTLAAKPCQGHNGPSLPSQMRTAAEHHQGGAPAGAIAAIATNSYLCL